MTILNAYKESKKVINQQWMEPLESKSLQVEKQMPEDLWECIKSFKPTQGWIQTLDEIQLIQNDFKQIDDIIQTAELVNGSGQSLHIRPINHQATVFIYTETQGDDYLSATYQHYIQHKTITNKKFQASYQVYWEINSKDPRQPIKHSRFIDFKP